MKHIVTLAFISSLCGGPVFADSAVLMSCTFNQGAKAVIVGIDDDLVTYSFGPPGKSPELALEASVVDVGYEPWPGAGRAIWEAIIFTNGTYAYEVGMSFDRTLEDENVYGGITVTNAGDEIAYLECDPGSGFFPYDGALSDAKFDAGLCVERGAKGAYWQPCDAD